MLSGRQLFLLFDCASLIIFLHGYVASLFQNTQLLSLARSDDESIADAESQQPLVGGSQCFGIKLKPDKQCMQSKIEELS